MTLSPLLLTATYQPIKNCHSFQEYLDELVHFVFWIADKYLGHEKCLIVMNSHAINCNILIEGIHLMFMQLSCILPGVLYSNLVLVNGHNKGLLIKSWACYIFVSCTAEHKVDANSFTLTLIWCNFLASPMSMHHEDKLVDQLEEVIKLHFVFNRNWVWLTLLPKLNPSAYI